MECINCGSRFFKQVTKEFPKTVACLKCGVIQQEKLPC